MKHAKFFATLVLLLLSPVVMYSQARLSTQGHESSVTALCAAGNSGFFSAGQDGFVIRWNENGMGQHFQMSDLSIKMIAYNKATNEIAIYETDGAAINRVSVWSWTTFTRKYSKRFTDTVTAISFSAKGTYLMVSTAAVNGTFLFNAKTGSRVRTITEVPAISSMMRTSDSEKTAIMYSITGSLTYYDMSANKQKAKFSVESRMDQPILFGTPSQPNRFFAGVKDNSLLVFDATKGTVIAAYTARNPYICTSITEQEEGLYFITYDGKDYSLRLVDNQTLEDQLSAPYSKVYNPPAPLVVKTFTGLTSRETFTAVAKVNGQIVLGTSSGNICIMTDIPESEKYTLSAMTEIEFEKVYDIVGNENTLYCLTNNAIYRTSYDANESVSVALNANGQTNFELYGDSVIVWSKGTRRAVQRIQLGSESSPLTLFTPTTDLQNVRLFGDQLVYIQGNSSVGLYDLKTGRNSEIYSGTSIQDAVLINSSELYVAKTRSNQTDSALISVNIKTMETVPLSIDGSVVFSLSYDFDNAETNAAMLYGIVISAQEEDAITRTFSFNPLTKTISYILTYPDEDTTAFTSLSTPVLFTNIGKTVVYACNLKSKRNMQYKRSSAMAVKVCPLSDKLAVLNSDGSVTWYNLNTQAVLADRVLLRSGNWK